MTVPHKQPLVAFENLQEKSDFALFGNVEVETAERKCKTCNNVTKKHILNLVSANGLAEFKDERSVHTCILCGTITVITP